MAMTALQLSNLHWLAHAASGIGRAAALALLGACAPLGWFGTSPAPLETAHTDSAERVDVAGGRDDAQATEDASTRVAVRDSGVATPSDGDALGMSAARPSEAGAPVEPASAPSAGERATSGGDETPDVAAEGASDAPPTGDLRIDRGAGQVPLLIPRDEELLFEVEIDLGPLGDPTVGRVTLSSGADPYVEGLPSARGGAKKSGREVGWIKSRAQGRHLSYELDHELYVRHLPQVMPHILLTDTQRGSENRRRKLKVGLVDGVLTAVHDHDGHCKGCDNPEHFVESRWLWGKPSHCEKCKSMAHREWKPSQSRAVPEGTLDMLSAVYLARSMINTGQSSTVFPLIDKQKLWNVALERGRRKLVRVPAGRFDCVEVQLKTSRPAGEPSDDEGFQGLFGIHGTIQIWFEATTGVPVLISGTLPVPILGDLDVRVQLKKATGAPSAFKPAD